MYKLLTLQAIKEYIISMAKKKLSIEDEFKLLSQEEQILLRPDTMIGSIEEQTKDMWCYNDGQIRKESLTYIPGFLKLFDEILTNASDHAQRGKNVKTIKVNIEPDWTIKVWNDGDGIPVAIHKEHKMYIPEMILGRLNSGSNYNDEEDRYGAGRNGVGSGCVALFSDKFIIDCADGKKSYYQELSNNAKDKTKPKIKSCKKSYTSITYNTDNTRLPIDEYNNDTMKLCIKRVYDIAAYNPKIKVYFNDELIDIKKITDWMNLHIDSESEIFMETINDKWDIGLTQSNTDIFEHCSIVNGNTTWHGGTHVDFIMNKIVKRLTTDLTKGKRGIKIRSSDIKNKFHLFLICKIPNPKFDAQTKENLITKVVDKIDLSDKLYKQLLKSEIIESILEWIQLREQAQLNKLNKKSAGKTMRVDKLVDAHKAGTSTGWKSSLCISEGLSARGTVITGLSVVGRNYWGVFPIKGRPLNVRDAATSKIIANAEIANIIKIIGLVSGKKYTDIKDLRYGKIIFFTDADVYGISIKGLLINFIHKMWPELLELGFCYEFITPIVKATKGKIVKEYYDLDKYKNDKNTNKLINFKIKYYKGLGTINANEIKDMFKNIDKHLIKFNYVQERDSDKIDMVFNTKRANERKDWMLKYTNNIIDDKFGKDNNIDKFIDTEFIQFSNYDNVISIPHLIDGFKPSQRKILFGAFKRNMKSNISGEIKVAQFGSYVAEHTHYNHGEENMYGTIVAMSQNFIGGNNIPLFIPSGNFGSRRDPKSAASPRYIFTYLNPITNLIFRKEDEHILNYLYEDEHKIEPEYYLPIIPTLLVNGTSGIGTGWSTDIPKYNPLSLIQVIQKKLVKPEIRYTINPSYKDWNGDLAWIEEKNTYASSGIYTLSKNKKNVLVTELPLDVSIDKYISYLNKLCDDKKIKKYIDNSTNSEAHITIELLPGTKLNNLSKTLKLINNVSINNMNTFLNNKIVKWDSAEELLNTWFDIRLKYYETRKKEWIKILEEKYNKYFNLLCFINAVIKNELVINNRTKKDIIQDLIEMEFDKIDNNFDYLLNMPIYHLSKDKYDEYKATAKSMKKEIKEYKILSPEEIWDSELTELKLAIEKTGY